MRLLEKARKLAHRLRGTMPIKKRTPKKWRVVNLEADVLERVMAGAEYGEHMAPRVRSALEYALAHGWRPK